MRTRPTTPGPQPASRQHVGWQRLLAHIIRRSPAGDDHLARYRAEIDLLVEQIERLQHLGLAIELARQRLHEGVEPEVIDSLLAYALECLGPDDLEPVALDVLDVAETPDLDMLDELWRAPASEDEPGSRVAPPRVPSKTGSLSQPSPDEDDIAEQPPPEVDNA